MDETRTGWRVDHGIVKMKGGSAALRAARLLCLAATPTFAIMALLAGVHAGGHPGALCGAAQDASPLNGMVTMYLLMGIFHSAPWLGLMTSGRSTTSRTGSVNHT
jgi:hypothetical protein